MREEPVTIRRFVMWIAAGSDQDELFRRKFLAQAARQLRAIHPGHGQIQEGHVRPIRSRDRERGFTSICHAHVLSHALEQATEHLGDVVLVVHHQHAARWWQVRGHGGGWNFVAGERERECDFTSAAAPSL